MNTTTDKFMQETQLTAEGCMKGVPNTAPPASIDLDAFDDAIRAANLTYLAEIDGNRDILIKLFQTYEDSKEERWGDLKEENEKYEELLQKYMKENAYLKLHGCLGTKTSAPAFIPPDEDLPTKGR